MVFIHNYALKYGTPTNDDNLIGFFYEHKTIQRRIYEANSLEAYVSSTGNDPAPIRKPHLAPFWERDFEQEHLLDRIRIFKAKHTSHSSLIREHYYKLRIEEA